jgi:putative N6-adenine-specific DNA methylase
MNQLHLFLPCAAGVEGFLADEVHAITGASGQDLLVGRGGVMLRGMWRDAMLLNLHSRLAQRVLIELAHHVPQRERSVPCRQRGGLGDLV